MSYSLYWIEFIYLISGKHPHCKELGMQIANSIILLGFILAEMIHILLYKAEQKLIQ